MEEIDLLRPNVVHSEETQWFEFLLDKDLLEKHLKKKEPNPSPEKLIATLIQQSIIPESQQQTNDLNSPDVDLNKNEGLVFGRKQMALKILALKVSSYLKWDLATLEKCLPIQKQVQILGDLCSITSGRIVNLPLSLVHEVPIATEGNKAALNFALTLYHRWVLRAQVLKGSYTKIKPFVHIVSTPEQTNGYSIQDDLFIASLEPCTPTSIEFLNQIISDPEPFKMLKFDSFIPLDSKCENMSQKFENEATISKTELKTQIHFDLLQYYMFVKKYDLAKVNVVLCRDYLTKLKDEYAGKSMPNFEFCNIDEDELRGYLLACGVFDETPNLMMKMHRSMQNNYKVRIAITIP
jgi:integrator complex subunit 8